jgi:hypothetical protein
MGWVVNATNLPLYLREREAVLTAGWFPGPVWIGAENIIPTGIWSQERPARN